MQVLPVCDGVGWLVNPDNSIICDGVIRVMESQAIPVPFELSQLDPVILAQAFGAGAMLFMSIWAPAKGIGILLSLIRRR